MTGFGDTPNTCESVLSHPLRLGLNLKHWIPAHDAISRLSYSIPCHLASQRHRPIRRPEQHHALLAGYVSAPFFPSQHFRWHGDGERAIARRPLSAAPSRTSIS